MWQIISGWDVIGSVASGILGLGILAVIWQIHLLKKQNRLNAFNSLVQQWGDKEERESRRYVIREFRFDEGDDLKDLDDGSRRKVELILGRCNRISFSALNGLVPKKDALEFVGRPMVQCWDRAESFIKARRRQVSESEEGKPGSYMYFLQQFVSKNRKKLGM